MLLVNTGTDRAVRKAGIFVLPVLVLVSCACCDAPFDAAEWDAHIAIEAGDAWVHPFPLLGPITKPNYPTFALWITDVDGTYIETVFVTKKMSNASWAYADDGRPEALPLWSKVRGGQPTSEAPVADAVSGATPRGSQAYGLSRGNLPDSVLVWLEINHSVDYNASYGEGIEDADDPYYSGGKGGSGQPALVYRALVDFMAAPGTSIDMALVGRSEAGGAWKGTDYYADGLDDVTTARSIVGRVKVNLR